MLLRWGWSMMLAPNHPIIISSGSDISLGNDEEGEHCTNSIDMCLPQVTACAKNITSTQTHQHIYICIYVYIYILE